MPLRSLTSVLADAEAGGYAVGAFNCSDLNQAHAVMQAAEEERSPVIVQVLAGVHPYPDEGWWWSRLRELVLSYPGVDAALHLDHGASYDDCVRAIGHGFTGVMIDASRDADGAPAALRDNIAATARVAEVAAAAGVGVEGELGTIGGAEGGAGSRDIEYTDPALAREFVTSTGVDALAVAIGTSHGAVKGRVGAGCEGLRLELLDAIKREVPATYLVLHGSSSIPPEFVAAINESGGRLEPSAGIPAWAKREAIDHAIRKINQGTDSHLAWTAALRRELGERPGEVDPAGPLAAGIGAMRAIVAERMHEFGSAGRTP